MAETILELKRRAIKLGMDKGKARSADRKAIMEFIESAGKSKSPAKKKAAVAKKKTGTKAPAAKKAATKKNSTKKAAPAKRGRPAGKKAAPKAAATKRTKKNDDSGRHIIGKLNFDKTEGWNPRDGSPVGVIFKALKRFKGDVEKTTAHLLPNVRDFVTTKKRDGTKRTKDEMQAMLKYRVARTKWEFATRTGQHEQSENRVEYGTGAYASAKKPAKRTKAATTKKSTTKKSPAKKAGRKKAKR